MAGGATTVEAIGEYVRGAFLVGNPDHFGAAPGGRHRFFATGPYLPNLYFTPPAP